jgi:hypothetical protein
VSAVAVTEREVERDTGCFVYAVVRPDERDTLPPHGIDDVPLRLVTHGSVAAVVSEISLDRPPGRRAELLAYSSVVDALLAGGVVVPVQFGSVLLDEQSVVEDLLAPAEPYFADLLDQLTGRSQLNVRASYRGDAVLAEVVAQEPDVATLRARTRGQPPDALVGDRVRLGELVAQAMEVKRDEDTAALCDVILPLAVAHRLTRGSGLETVFDLTLLVDDDRRPELEDLLEDLAEAVHERIGLRLVGPVAPYDFVGEQPWG